MSDEPEDDSPRQRARRQVKEAGDRSSKVARALMLLSEPGCRELELEDRVREVLTAARQVRPPGARRREERRLAGVLRRSGFEGLEAKLAAMDGEGATEELLLERGDAWYRRLMNEGEPACDAFVAEVGGVDPKRFTDLVQKARRADAEGPRGAAKTLQRWLVAALRESTKKPRPPQP